MAKILHEDKLKISTDWLRKFYKRNRIGHYKPQWKFHNPRSPIAVYNMKRKFIVELVRLLKDGKMVAFFDETSTHCWEKLSKVWSSRDCPLTLSLRKDRGRSVTVMGAICSHWSGEEFQYTITDKTNIKSVKFFLDCIAPLVPTEGGYLVLDNHPSHKSVKIINYAAERKLKLLFLPPSASELNPVECKFNLSFSTYSLFSDVVVLQARMGQEALRSPCSLRPTKNKRRYQELSR